ncbi:MAG: DUF5063 domain-containing protein [Dysgonamonadaceae bacterium]|jgi:hypothetical protein|nr:DUF5063 domain-containing protein [Dysgonamonadaceae bacterium]
MTNSHTNNIVYAPVTLDFVTVSVEFCSFLESGKVSNRNEWMLTVLRMLPLLYVKATMLPSVEIIDDDFPETFVSEQDYIRVSNQISSMMGEDNVYLDVFIEDMKYSDRPISSFISEDIADIYQDIRNFVSVYQYGLEETMTSALHICTENFRSYWGQKLVNVLRALHSLVYKIEDDNNFDDYNGEEENLWD